MELAKAYMLIFHSPVVPTIIQKGFSEHWDMDMECPGHCGLCHAILQMGWERAGGIIKDNYFIAMIQTTCSMATFNNICSFTWSFEFSLL